MVGYRCTKKIAGRRLTRGRRPAWAKKAGSAALKSWAERGASGRPNEPSRRRKRLFGKVCPRREEVAGAEDRPLLPIDRDPFPPLVFAAGAGRRSAGRLVYFTDLFFRASRTSVRKLSISVFWLGDLLYDGCINLTKKSSTVKLFFHVLLKPTGILALFPVVSRKKVA